MARIRARKPLQAEPFTVGLSGELTLRWVADVARRLSEALEEHASVRAEIAPDAEVDLTFVQLIEAARRAANDSGKVFSLAGPAQGPLLETLQRGGFLSRANPERRAFWLTESGAQQ